DGAVVVLPGIELAVLAAAAHGNRSRLVRGGLAVADLALGVQAPALDRAAAQADRAGAGVPARRADALPPGRALGDAHRRRGGVVGGGVTVTALAVDVPAPAVEAPHRLEGTGVRRAHRDLDPVGGAGRDL